MRITQAEVFPVALPLKKSFSIALGTMRHTFHAILRVTVDEGFAGYGEVATWHVVYGYDQQQLIRAVERYLGPAVIGMDPFDIEAILLKMDQVLPKNQMAKAGIEIACQDIRGKALGVPLSRLIGGTLADPVEAVQLVDIGPPDTAARCAREFVGEGFQCIKIKVGLNPEEDIERVRNVREAVGGAVRLRVDANQGYDRRTALKVCRALEAFDLQWIEQPLPDWDLEGLAELRSAQTTPVAVDESIFGIHDLYRIARAGAADIINIKVAKCGGIANSLKIAHAAQAMGLPCFLGGCIETGVGTAAALHLAACCPNLVAGVELAGSGIYMDDIISEPIMAAGSIPVPRGPGIGVEVDMEQLRRYSKPS